MSRRSIVIAAVVVVASAAILVAIQRGPGGPLPSHYTNKMMPLGPVDTSAADRACQTSKGHAKLVCLADLLKTGLSPELTARLQLPYAVADARKWSNFPPMGYRNRIGPTLAELTPTQLGVVKALMREAAGLAANEGYDEIEQILNADDFLQHNTGERGFASGNFHVAFIGTPAASGTWQLYFGGHHLGFASTYKDGVLVGATPSFRGVEPFTRFTENGRDNAPMAEERDAFAAMLGALTPEQQATAKLSQTFTDLIVGPQRDDNFPSTRVGVRVGDLTEAQRTLVMRAIETYVGDVDPPDAQKLLATYRGELAETWVAFSGTATVNAENDYVRIDGPSVWIEFSMQPGRSIPGVHPHSVWRDRTRDYGGNK